MPAKNKNVMSRPLISSTDYIYRPWSIARRQAAKAAALKRSGAKPGHRKLYGIQVPEKYFGAMKSIAIEYRNGRKASLGQTQRVIHKVLAMVKQAEG